MKGCLLAALCLVGAAQPAAAQSQGLSGSYFPERNFDAVSTLRIDPTINFQWGNGAPLEDFPADRFQVRWHGSLVAPESAYYSFQTRSDDGVRLYVDHQVLINQWRNQAPTIYVSRRIWLDAGVAVPISVEYYEQGGGAVMELYWQREGGEVEIIPETALRPWSNSQDTEGRVSTSFSRPYLWEGTNTNVARVLVARPHADLSEALTVELMWEGEGLERLTGRRGQVTIGVNQTITGFDVRLTDDLTTQEVQEVMVRAVGSELPAAILMIRDDDRADAVEASLLSGHVSAPGAEELVVSATPLFEEGEEGAEPQWVAGEPVDEFVVGDRYALSLPTGRYRVGAVALLAGELASLSLTEAALALLPSDASLIYDEAQVPVGVELNIPPSALALDFELLNEDMTATGGGEAGAVAGDEGGSTAGTEMGGAAEGGAAEGGASGEEGGAAGGGTQPAAGIDAEGGARVNPELAEESSSCQQGAGLTPMSLALLSALGLLLSRRRFTFR